MKKTILIVDDSDSIREVLNFTLEMAGHRVIKAINGEDGLLQLNDNKIDMIITDLHMPIMDGISFIKEIRQNELYKTVPILFLTTDSQQDKKNEAKQAGATGWIVKPFAPDKLLSAVSKLIGS